MRLLVHLLIADAQRFAPTIALWIAITIAATYVAGADLFVASFDTSPLFALGQVLQWVARIAVAGTLVAQVIQLHPLVGSDVWWRTRPVPPRVLLGSKLVLLGLLLIGLPALCDAVLMTIYEVPAGQIGRVLAEWSLIRAVALTVLMAGAALTRDFARFALLCGLGVAAATVAVYVALWAVVYRSESSGLLRGLRSSDFAATLVSRPSDPTAVVLAWLLLMAGALMLLRTQYVARSRRRAVTIGVLAGLVAWTTAVAWPWPLLHAMEPPPEWTRAPGAVELNGPRQTVFFDNAGAQNIAAPRWRTARASLHLSGVPAGWVATARLRRGTLEFDGVRLTTAVIPHTSELPTPDGERSLYRALQHVLGVEAVAGTRLSESASIPIMMLPAPQTPAAQVPAVFHGEMEVEFTQLEAVANLPLARGSSFNDGVFSMTLTEVQRHDGNTLLLVKRSWATSALDSRPPPSYTFYLRNRRQNEAVAGQSARPPANVLPVSPVPGLGFLVSPFGFSVEAGVIRFQSPAPVVARPGATGSARDRLVWTEDPWLADAEVVVVRATKHGSMIRPLTLTQLTLNGGT